MKQVITVDNIPLEIEDDITVVQKNRVEIETEDEFSGFKVGNKVSIASCPTDLLIIGIVVGVNPGRNQSFGVAWIPGGIWVSVENLPAHYWSKRNIPKKIRKIK